MLYATLLTTGHHGAWVSIAVSLRRFVVTAERDCSGVAWKAGFPTPQSSGELTRLERGSLGGMAHTIPAEPRQPLAREPTVVLGYRNLMSTAGSGTLVNICCG